MAAVVAIYDANALYSAPLRDVLMHLALTTLVEARWTDLIQAEWLRNVLKNRPDLEPSSLQRTQAMMNQAVPNALVVNFEPLIGTLVLPDANDRHVLAAAIASGANVIVTQNLSDFPRANLEPFGLEALSPDDFLVRLLNLNAVAVISALNLQRKTMKKPPMDAAMFLQMLEKQGLSKTVLWLKPYSVLL